jgi:hypothetical protein
LNDAVGILAMAVEIEYFGTNVVSGIQIRYFDDFKSIFFQNISDSCGHSLRTGIIGNFNFYDVFIRFIGLYFSGPGSQLDFYIFVCGPI